MLSIKPVITKLVWQLPPTLRDNLRNIYRGSIFRKQYPENQLFIQIVDGTTFHGGLTDRLKGIISSYLYCKIKNITFKIDHTSPFNLSSFLIPNNYNWTLSSKNKISKNVFECKLLYLIGDPTIQRLISLKTKSQIHCFSNRDIINELNNHYGSAFTWGCLFKELFKPSEYLQKEILKYKKITGENYYSAIFRFQNLLGDFIEYDDVKELDEINKGILINKCKQSIIELKRKLGNTRILITSDSKLFLNEISRIKELIVFPEDNVHMDNTSGQPLKIYQKSFTDFILISESLGVYSIGTPIMYKTEFPLYAAKINNIPFERIEI